MYYDAGRIRGLLPSALGLWGSSLEAPVDYEIRPRCYDPRKANDVLMEAFDLRRALRNVEAPNEVKRDWIETVFHSTRHAYFTPPGMSQAAYEYEQDLIDYMNTGD